MRIAIDTFSRKISNWHISIRCCSHSPKWYILNISFRRRNFQHTNFMQNCCTINMKKSKKAEAKKLSHCMLCTIWFGNVRKRFILPPCFSLFLSLARRFRYTASDHFIQLKTRISGILCVRINEAQFQLLCLFVCLFFRVLIFGLACTLLLRWVKRCLFYFVCFFILSFFLFMRNLVGASLHF